MKNFQWPDIMSDYSELDRPIIIINSIRIAVNTIVSAIALFVHAYSSINKYSIIAFAVLLIGINEIICYILRAKVGKKHDDSDIS